MHDITSKAQVGGSVTPYAIGIGGSCDLLIVVPAPAVFTEEIYIEGDVDYVIEMLEDALAVLRSSAEDVKLKRPHDGFES